MCRTPWYDERTIDDARRHARERAAVVIQAAWRMHTPAPMPLLTVRQ